MATYDLGTIGYTLENTGGPKTITELKQLAQAGIEAHRSTTQLSQGNRLSQYFASVDKQITAVNRNMQNHNRFLAQAGQQSNRFGVVTQQAGYQIGDFLVQVQSGTNWMVAFGQQATQLVGVLPLLGAGFMGLSAGALVALSAGLGIAIPLVTAIGAYFMRTSDSANAGAKEIDVYAEALQSLTSEIQKNQDAFLQAKFGVETAGRAQALQQEVTLRKEVADAQGRVLQMEQQLDSFRSGRGAAYINLAISGKKEEIALEEENLAALQEKLQIISAQNEAQRMLNGGLSVAAGIQKSIVDDKERELRIAKELKSFSENLAEGVEEPQKNLDIQREYQRLLQEGVKSVEAMALAQYTVETALNRSKIASGELTSDQIKTLEATNAVLLNTFILEEQFRQIVTEIELLEKGLSQAAIEGAKLANLDLSNLTDAAFDVLMLATNMGISVQAAANLALELGRLDRLNQNAGRGNTSNRPIEFGTGPNAGKTVEEVRRLAKKSDGTARIKKETEAVKELTEAEEQRLSILQSIEGSLESGFMSMVDGTKSVKDAFKSMAAEIIKELYRVYVVQQIVGAVSGGIGSFFGGSAPTSSPRPMARPVGLAVGGSIMRGKSYLVGENGPELVIPRHSGTVVNANQTANAGGGSGTTVVNNISVTGSDAAMVRVEIAKMIPQITNATKAAVIDARLRGGQMKSAFR